MGSLFSKHRRTTKEKGKTNAPVPDVQPSNGIDADHEVTAEQLLTASLSMPVKIVKALYDFAPLQSDDLAFRKGDKMKVIQSDDTENGDWWRAQHLNTGEEGQIPSNYVVEDSTAPEAQDWWFSYDRREANKQLMLSGNPSGTFLIRNSADLQSYALSVRVFDEQTNTFSIKHYRIRKFQDGQVGVSTKMPFNSVIELVAYYRENSDGLCCRLITPCPKEAELVPFKNLEVPRNSLQLVNKLGAGQFGEVWAALWQKTTSVAVKTLKPGAMSAVAFLDEAKTMHRLRHRKLVQLLGVCTHDEPMYIITELMSHGALLDYLRADEGRTITIGIVIDMAAQVADGMAYLEGKNFIHRDLRAANILVGDNNTVKVADFGLARILHDEEIYSASHETKFPIKWTAPEAAYDHKFSVKSDVWSYGVLLYEIVTYGRMPYPGMDGATTLQRVSDGYRMPRPAGRNLDCPPKMYEIMLKCWDSSPINRPTFRYLLHFFDDYATESEEHYRPPEDEQ